MPYIDKEKFRMHIIQYRHNPLKVILTDKEKEKFTRMLDEVPTADVVERKKGRWFFSDTDFLTHCSNCGQSEWKGYCPTPKEATEWMPICPKCGADMR